MGYEMKVCESYFRIKAENKTAALAAIMVLKRQVERGEFFVSAQEFMNAKDLCEAVHAWRWSMTTDESGDIIGIRFDKWKYADDDVLFKILAPFVEPGSYIEMQGEDGYSWRWDFDGKTCAGIPPAWGTDQRGT